jgi:prevent-host-death family protein
LTPETIIAILCAVFKEDSTMPTVMSVNEAKTNFSGMLSEVESGLVSFTIMRYGRPIARVVPVERSRKIRPLPGYGTKIAVKGDLFADDSALWENA